MTPAEDFNQAVAVREAEHLAELTVKMANHLDVDYITDEHRNSALCMMQTIAIEAMTMRHGSDGNPLFLDAWERAAAKERELRKRLGARPAKWDIGPESEEEVA